MVDGVLYMCMCLCVKYKFIRYKWKRKEWITKKERKEPETEEFNEEKGKPSTQPNGENTIMFKVRWILFCGKMFVCVYVRLKYTYKSTKNEWKEKPNWKEYNNKTIWWITISFDIFLWVCDCFEWDKKRAIGRAKR